MCVTPMTYNCNTVLSIALEHISDERV